MKKYFSLFAAVAVVATSFISCSKDSSPLTEEQELQKVKISFNAVSDQPGTKTYFGDKTDGAYPTIWSATQKVKTIFNLNNNFSCDAVVVPAGDGKTASFDAEFTGLPDDDTQLWLQAVSPATAFTGNCEGWGLGFQVPSTQTPTMTSVDENAHILFAALDNYVVANAMPEKITLSFSHIAAYGKFMLKNFPEDVTIKSIELSSTEYITGNSMYPANEYYSGSFEQSKTLTINPSQLSAESNSAKVFWFSFLPVNLEGKTLTVKILTDAGVYTKAITFPSGKGNFQKGRVASFNINMSGIDPEPLKYILVTDYSELTAGSEIIIAPQSADYAMSVENWTYPHRKVEAITRNTEGNIVNPSGNVQIFVLGKGASDNTVTFMNKNGGFAGKYLGALNTTSPSDYNHAQDWTYFYNEETFTSDYSSSFDVFFEQNNDALITISNAVSRYKYMCYDGPNSQFKMDYAYLATSGVSIYKLEGSGQGGEQLVIPTPEFHFLSGVGYPSGYDGMYYINATTQLPASGGTYEIEYEINYPVEGGFVQSDNSQYSYSGWYDWTLDKQVANNKVVVTVPANTGSARSAYFILDYSYKVDGNWKDSKIIIYLAQAGQAVIK